MLTVLTLAACGGGKKSSSSRDFSEFRWPNSDIAKLLPVPKSNIGQIWIDSVDQLNVDVAETSQQDFNTYVDDCMALGFTSDYTKLGNNFFSAENESGYSLLLNYYEEDSIMSLICNAPWEDEAEEPDDTVEEPPDNEDEEELDEADDKTDTLDDKSDEADAGGTPAPESDSIEWKEWLRLYEEWVDEYVELVKKYNKNPSDTTLLNDYLKSLEKLAEWAEQGEKIEDELTGNDLKEYLATMTRILGKLNSIS